MNRRDFFKLVIGIYGLSNISLFARENRILKLHQKQKKMCIIGIGGGGSNIVEDIFKIDNKNTLICINSDYQSLKQKSTKYKILLGWNEKAGLGCGGKDQCGKALINKKVKSELYKLTKDISQINIISTLGGGVGSGATPEIIKYLKSLNKKIVVYTTIPFSFEGTKRSNTAYTALNKIKLYADRLIVLENDNLINDNKNKFLGIKDTFKITSINIYKKILNDHLANQT